MTENIIKSIIFLSLALIIYSCNDDDDVIDNPPLFTIHASEVQGFSGNRYVMATSSLTGEVLYSDEMTSFQDDIMFDAKDAETVDITYASEYNTGFNITTYRNIKTEFKLSRFLYPCYEDQFTFDTLYNSYVDIILPGTKEIVEIINPGYDHSDIENVGNITIDEENKIIYDLDNDLTIINAFLGNSSLDHQFVFRFSGEQDYKSIVIKRADWIKVDDNNYIHELAIEDLSPCTGHTIDVGIDAVWIIESEALTTNGDRISTAKWSNFSQNQSGETIRLFLQDDLEIEQLFIKIRENSTYEGLQLQGYYDDIPSSISLKEYDNEVDNLGPNTYNYSTTENFDLIKTSYQYINNNNISSWDIYQTSSSLSEYTLPEIESEYLDKTILMKSSLMNPIRFLAQIYSLDADINQIYHETGIDRQLNCLDFDSSYESYDF